MRNILLFLHIVAACAWLGANLLQVAVASMGRSEPTGFQAAWHRISAKAGKSYYMPVGILILASGILLVVTSNGAWTFEDLFVGIGVTVVIIGAILGPTVLAPSSNRAAEAFEAGDQPGAKAAMGKLSTWGLIDTLLVLIAIYAMVAKL